MTNKKLILSLVISSFFAAAPVAAKVCDCLVERNQHTCCDDAKDSGCYECYVLKPENFSTEVVFESESSFDLDAVIPSTRLALINPTKLELVSLKTELFHDKKQYSLPEPRSPPSVL